jgi:hypothetical protein
MSEPAYERLAARVDALERQSRRLKGQLIAALVGLLCLGTVSATTAQPHAISFSGPKGTLRIDASGVHLLTSKGREMALFGYTKASTIPAVRFMDASGTNRLVLGLTTVDDGMVRMFSRNGNEAVTLDGNQLLDFFDNSGTKRMFVGLTTADTPELQMLNASGSQQTALSSTFLKLGDSGGMERGYLGVTTEGDTVLKLWDSSHTVRNVAGAFTDGSWGFASYNSYGNATWSSP